MATSPDAMGNFSEPVCRQWGKNDTDGFYSPCTRQVWVPSPTDWIVMFTELTGYIKESMKTMQRSKHHQGQKILFCKDLL